MRWYSVEDDGETGTHTPPGFGGGKYPYLTGSGGRVFEAGHAVLHRERLLGDGSVGAEGVLSGQASLPAAARCVSASFSIVFNRIPSHCPICLSDNRDLPDAAIALERSPKLVRTAGTERKRQKNK